jgi:hypothetical protein
MPVINGVYLKDFAALPSAVVDANIIPIAISGNQIAYRTTVGGIVTDARVTSKLLTGLSVTGGAVVATDTILQAFGKVQNQINSKVSSVGLTMPSAFSVANSPITSAGTLAVTAIGAASQYIRGDGALADFPTTGGGGSSVSYYLNGSISQGTIGGNAYYEMNKTPVIGTGTDFTIAADGYIAQFITDANDPASLLIPAGNWNVEMYFSASSSGGTPSFYVEVYKYNGTTFTLLGSSATTPEGITNGTAIDIYYTSVGIPETVLTLTDRLAIRVYVTHSGRTITLHTEDNHLSEIVTTFSNGLTALNGLTKQAQYFAVGSTGTDFNISSSVDTHTFNIPSASASNRGLITTGTQTIAGAKTLTGALVGTTANFTGQLTLGSTITNGTYTYTLPSATGTLALTSALTGYVPYTGATGPVDLGTNNGITLADTGTNMSISISSSSTGSGAIRVVKTSAGTAIRIENSNSGTAYYSNNSSTGTGFYAENAAIATGDAFLYYLQGTGTKARIDYLGNITGASFIKSGGTSSQFLKADGSVDSTTYQAAITLGAIGITPNANAASLVGSILNLEPASVNFGGVVTTGTQTFAGDKTLTGSLYGIGLSMTGTSGDIIGSVATSGKAIRGTATTGFGVYSSATTGTAIYGESTGTGGASINGTAGNGIGGYFLNNATGFATLYVTNNGSGNLANFSNSAGTKFTINNAGNLGNGTYTYTLPSATGTLALTSAIPANPVGGTGTTNYIPKFTAASTIGNSNLINDASGNLGLGVTPSASTFPAIESSVGIFTGVSETNVGANNYFNSGWKYITSSVGASRYRQGSGEHQWYTAPSGTAGNAITFTQAMTLTASGVLTLPTTGTLEVGYATVQGAGYKLDVNGTGRFSGGYLDITGAAYPYLSAIGNATTTGGGIRFYGSTTQYAEIYGEYESSTNGNLIFRTRKAGNITTALTIASTGAATFSSTITSGSITANSGGRTLTFDNITNYGQSLIINAAGSLPLILQNNGVASLTLASTGAATFSSTVTATGFFESSSVVGKDIIKTNPLTNLNLDVIQYTRKADENKDVRYGYSAEQIHSLMPELTDKDVTAVKYLDVHTLLIAQLQQEIKELKAKLN